MVKTKKSKPKKQKSVLGAIVEFLAWLTGIIVSLAVAFGMVDQTLSIRWIPLGVTIFFGWVVIITTLLGIILAIAKLFE